MGTRRRDSWTEDRGTGREEMRAVPAEGLTVAAAMTLMRRTTDVRLAECPVVRHLTGDMLSGRRPAHPPTPTLTSLVPFALWHCQPIPLSAASVAWIKIHARSTELVDSDGRNGDGIYVGVTRNAKPSEQLEFFVTLTTGTPPVH